MSLSRVGVFVRNLRRKIELYQASPLSTSSNVNSIWNKAFGKYLLLTNTSTSFALMGLGDLLQQEIEYQRHMLPERYDWHRLRRMLSIGLVYGPLTHYFYKYLDFFFPKRNMATITRKILVDQMVMSPVCIAIFFYGLGIMEGKKWEECTREIEMKFVEVYMVDCGVWIPVQYINFYFMPVKYQVIYINFVTMLCNIFLSYIKNREIAQEGRYKFEYLHKILKKRR